MSKTLNFAIIGCGYWGVNYVRTLSDLPETGVLVVCDKDEARLQQIGERFPKVELCTDYREVLADNRIDAVIVSTTATHHFDITRDALESGRPVLVEKPLTTTAVEAERLVEIADQRELQLMVGHVFLFNPGVEKVRTYIQSGDIGEVYYLYSRRTNLGPIRHDVNAVWDLAPHDVAIFNYLLGEAPEWVSGVSARVLRNGREDVGFLVLGYSDNRLGHIHVSWADPNKVRELVVVGSNQRIAFDDLNPQEMVRVYEKGVAAAAVETDGFVDYRLSVRDGDIISPHINVSEPLKNQVRHFIDCVINNQQPITDGQNGLDVVRALEAANYSASHNGIPVDLTAARVY